MQWIFLILVFIFLWFWFIKPFLNMQKLKKIFNKSSTIIFGKKGSGKDLLTQSIIKARKKHYLSNCNYGYDFEDISLIDINLDPNTFKTFLENKIETIKPIPAHYETDIYISDAGIYLPSTEDTTLNKMYKSLPLYYALSRHLYNQNIHCNTQNLERVWKKLREQADIYIKVKYTIRIFNTFFVRYYIYDNYNTALEGIRPLKKLKINKYGRTESDIFNATKGEIIGGYIKINKKHIKYDTHEFHKKVFNTPYPITNTKEKLKMFLGKVKNYFINIKDKTKTLFKKKGGEE